ncbi:MAG: hypothetical protein PVI90_10670 [Desulfobacteraceae bacterium]|jgi:hypothetical protein
METIAVYSESKIRTYGFNFKKNLILCELMIQIESLEFFGKELQALAASFKHFHLVWACTGEPGKIKFFILCDQEYRENIECFFNYQKLSKIIQNVRYETSMDLIYFQGPHFGDRHGIADFTLNALIRHELLPKAMTCSGAAVYLVFSNSSGKKAKDILSSTFEVPQKK